jgi:LSD1 subclass zinc finger protein
MQENYEPTQEINQELSCSGCAAVLKYNPGTISLQCEHCGAENEIAGAEKAVVIEELDYEKIISESFGNEEKETVTIVQCNGCGASTTLSPNTSSDECPFCGTSIVITSGTTCSVHKPQYLLPFKISSKEALAAYKKWMKSLWWAPNNIKHYVDRNEKLAGIYTPYWTYDSDTQSLYVGERGDDYYVNESYTATENGKTVTKTRSVKKTRWRTVTGSVKHFFDDILVLASHSLPKKQAENLEPWDLENLSHYNDKFLSGFRTESYQVDIKEGFSKAQSIMDEKIREMVRRNIGGDQQRIHSVKTAFNNITFKHILLPVWISTYRYKNKPYRFLINGRTGEVQGERPYSIAKISTAIMAAIIILMVLFYFFGLKS